MSDRLPPEVQDRGQPIPFGEPWRTGNHLGRTLYIGGRVVGLVESADLANAIAAIMNGQRVIGPDRAPMRAIGRTLYERGVDVGYFDTLQLAVGVADMVNDYYGHEGRALTPDPANNDALAITDAKTVAAVRAADVRAADIRLDLDGPTVQAAARALAARWGTGYGQAVELHQNAADVALEALTAAAPAILAAGGAATLDRLADEEAAWLGEAARLVQFLRHAAAEAAGTATAADDPA